MSIVLPEKLLWHRSCTLATDHSNCLVTCMRTVQFR